MYLTKLQLQNIKCFEDASLTFPVRDGNYAGWNVILGENGRGKSTILRSLALATLAPREAVIAAEEHAGNFARQDARGSCSVKAGIVFSEAELEKTGATTNKRYYRKVSFSSEGHLDPDIGKQTVPSIHLERTLPHLLCYGYGPFRRLNGASASMPNAFRFPEALSRFLTLFSDDIGLADATQGLITLYIASIDRQHHLHSVARQTLEAVLEVVNSLLPGGVRIDGVTSEKVRFRTIGGVELSEKELSDGYRSFLALVFDLLRHLALRFEARFPELIRRQSDHVAVDVEAAVLIDEADAHLHPSWQRELGQRLRRVFPRIQFIVATHSPFIAQEAADGGLFVLRGREDGTVMVEQPIESVRGWTASQILTSPLFGLQSTRDPETEFLIRESADLTARERGGTLTPAQKRHLAVVQQQLSETLSAPGETYSEMKRQQEMADYVDRTLKRLEGQGQ